MPRLGVTVLSPLGVPLAMKATPSSQAGSADPPVSIVTTSSHTPLGGGHLCPFSAHAQNPWRATHRPANGFLLPPDQEIVRCDERGSLSTTGEACRCKVCALCSLQDRDPWPREEGEPILSGILASRRWPCLRPIGQAGWSSMP